MRSTFIHIPLLGLAALFITLQACSSNKKDKEHSADSLVSKKLTADDSMEMVRDIDSTDYLSMFKNKTNIWASSVLDDKGMRWASFKLIDFWKDDSLKQLTGNTLSKSFLDDYAIFLRWSPDSSYILDRGSYGVTMNRDKKGQLYIQDGEIDSEVRLYKPKDKQGVKLFFCGPTTQVWDAHWTDSSQVALLGISDTSARHRPDTLLWLVNVKDNFFRKYKYTRQ